MRRDGKELEGGSKVLAAALTLHDSLELFAVYFWVSNRNLASILCILRSKSFDDAAVVARLGVTKCECLKLDLDIRSSEDCMA
jgi:hypothetical protein